VKGSPSYADGMNLRRLLRRSRLRARRSDRQAGLARLSPSRASDTRAGSTPRPRSPTGGSSSAPRTGSLLLRRAHQGSCAGRTRPPATSTPRRPSGRSLVLIGSLDGIFYAFDAATGDVRWRFHANGKISGSASVVDGIVYFSTLANRTYGLEARTGRAVWIYPDGEYTPVVADSHPPLRRRLPARVRVSLKGETIVPHSMRRADALAVVLSLALLVGCGSSRASDSSVRTVETRRRAAPRAANGRTAPRRPRPHAAAAPWRGRLDGDRPHWKGARNRGLHLDAERDRRPAGNDQERQRQSRSLGPRCRAGRSRPAEGCPVAASGRAFFRHPDTASSTVSDPVHQMLYVRITAPKHRHGKARPFSAGQERSHMRKLIFLAVTALLALPALAVAGLTAEPRQPGGRSQAVREPNGTRMQSRSSCSMGRSRTGRTRSASASRSSRSRTSRSTRTPRRSAAPSVRATRRRSRPSTAPARTTRTPSATASP